MYKEVIFGGIGYYWEVRNKKVYFDESCPFWGCQNSFYLERGESHADGNYIPGIWYFGVEPKDDHDDIRIPASHVGAAIKWCNDRFGNSFESYQNEFLEEV